MFRLLGLLLYKKTAFSVIFPAYCRCTYTHSKTGYVISEAFARLEGQTSIKL